MAVELALAPTASSRDDDYGDAEMAEPTEEVEMSDEMIAFFRKTMEHRMERRRIAAARNLSLRLQAIRAELASVRMNRMRTSMNSNRRLSGSLK